MRLTVLTAALLATAGIAHADAPQVPSNAPYIVLSENLDEPNGYGFCLDTFGAGKSDLMHTHTCKPAAEGKPRGYEGHDTRFEYDSSSLQIMSYPFEGFCMQVLVARGKTEFALLECSDHPRQKFIYDEADQTLRLDEDRQSCLAVSTETIPAGPWVKRVLTLQNCDDVDPSLKRWSIVTE